MDIDAERLISLVEERPPIYNITLKEHHNKEIVDKLWEEICKDIGAGAAECKNKWNSIRSSYARYLRELKRMPSGSAASKRKKWYLAESMHFLKDFVGQHRQSTSNIPVSNTPNESDLTEEDVEEMSNADDGDNTSSSVFVDRPTTPVHPSKIPTSKTPKLAAVVGSVAGPMINFLKSRTNSDVNRPTDATLAFFESLVPDVNKLTPRRQRNFKQHVLSYLNSLMDEQDAEIAGSPQYSQLSTVSQTVTPFQSRNSEQIEPNQLTNYNNTNTWPQNVPYATQN